MTGILRILQVHNNIIEQVQKTLRVKLFQIHQLRQEQNPIDWLMQFEGIEIFLQIGNH